MIYKKILTGIGLFRICNALGAFSIGFLILMSGLHEIQQKTRVLMFMDAVGMIGLGAYHLFMFLRFQKFIKRS